MENSIENVGSTSAKDVQNVTTKPREQVKVTTKIIERAVTQANQNVGKWRSASLVARSIINPNRTQLHEIYCDVVLDPHLTSLMRTLKMKVVSGEFNVCNADGTENEELTDKLNVTWFREYMEHFVDSIFYGHSLIQLGGIVNDQFTDLELVNRDHVIPEKGKVKISIGDNIDSGISFRESPYKEWLIECGSKDDLGLLHKATPFVIWKKGILGAWSQYAELFGMPVRVGRTDIANPELKKNMESMLKNMTQSSYAVLHPDDMLEMIGDKNSDSFNVYDKFIDKINAELSKLVLGQTGTTDEKSFAGSANVHNDILNDMVLAIKQQIESHFEKHVLPLLQYHRIFPLGVRGKWDNETKITVDQQFKMVSDLLKSYTIPAQWINDTFSIPVEEKTIPEPLQQQPPEKIDSEKIKSIIPDIETLYNNIIS